MAPNDEAFDGHPLGRRGLMPYGAFEIKHSSWIRELERMNSVHPYHSAERFEEFRHYVLSVHDTTFECVANGFDYETEPLGDTFTLAIGLTGSRPSATRLPRSSRWQRLCSKCGSQPGRCGAAVTRSSSADRWSGGLVADTTDFAKFLAVPLGDRVASTLTHWLSHHHGVDEEPMPVTVRGQVTSITAAYWASTRVPGRDQDLLYPVASSGVVEVRSATTGRRMGTRDRRQALQRLHRGVDNVTARRLPA